MVDSSKVSQLDPPAEGREGDGGTPRVLVVSHNPEVRHYIQKGVACGELDSSAVTDLDAARDMLARHSAFDVIVVEIDEPLEETATEDLEDFCREFAPAAVVAIAPRPSPELVRDVMRRGVRDFVTDPFDSRGMARCLRAASAARAAGASPAADAPQADCAPQGSAVQRCESPGAAAKSSDPLIVTRNRATRRILEMVDRVAPTASTVLIEGESGTGKELIARRIHVMSDRAEGPFIEVHCGAIPPSLLESELFGHEKGSFTGAISRQVGLFELAHKGTIFLDEIAEMDLEMQVKLLRVLQERNVRRVGGKVSVKIDVRVVAATNRDLAAEVEAKRFRADLFYRVNVIAFRMPPLRDRNEDVPALVEFFVEKLRRTKGLARKTFHPDVMKRFQAMRWVGNIRELENVVERLVLLSAAEEVRPDDLEGSLNEVESPAATAFASELTLDDVKKIHIRSVLLANGGNKMKSARVLGINIKTLYNLIQRFNISLEE